MSIEKDDTAGFLSRWSKRKLTPEDERVESEKKSELEQATHTDDTSKQVEKSDSEQQAEIPIWQQKDADPLLKKQALKDLFQQSEFGTLDGLNEYDEDYTSFTGLGKVVTREMKRMLELAEQKTRPEAEQGEQAVDDATPPVEQPEIDKADAEPDEREDTKRV